MAEVTFLGLGPIYNPPDSVTPPNDTAQLIPGSQLVPGGTVVGPGPINSDPSVRLLPGTQAVGSGNVVGVVATVNPQDVVIGASGLPPQTTVVQLGTVLPAAPVSVSPQESDPLFGPMASVQPFTVGPTLAFTPGFINEILVAIGNSSELAQLPGVTPGVATPFELATRDVATLKRGMRITFTADSGVNAALRGQSFDIIDYAQNITTSSATGVAAFVRDIIQLGTTMPAINGTRDTFVLQGRQLVRNSPTLEIILS